jgi:outer membrane protein assembly factor BamB
MKPLIAVALFAVATQLIAAEKSPWPQFRGPNGSGIAAGAKPPVEIGPEKNVKWKVAAPEGLSSPIIAGDKIVMTAFENDKLYTIAYNRADGKEAWRAQAPAKQIEKYYKPEGSPAASTCATDGERIVSYFGSCGLFCYDLSGKELWKLEMPTISLPGDFGSGVSPIIADGVVVLLRDERDNARIIALNLADGSPKWEKKRQSPVSYSTPIIWETAGGKQIITAGHAKLIAYDLQSGEEKWSVTGMPSGCCTSPVAMGDTLLFAGWSPGNTDDPEFQMPPFDAILKDDADKDGAISKAEAEKTFFKDFFDSQDSNKDGKLTRDEWDALIKFMREGVNSAFAIKPGGSGDVSESHVLWRKKRGLPYIATAMALDGRLITVKDGGMVSAYDAKSGTEIYVQKRVAAPGRYYASPVSANGLVYLIALEDGAVTVIKAGGDKPEVVSEGNTFGERVAATPAIAGDTIYVRTAKHLYAFGEKR